MSGVPKHRRNPRRAYTADGTEITPASIGNSKSNRATGILVFCECGHDGTIPFGDTPDDAIVVDVALRLRCSACGEKGRITTRPDFTGAHDGVPMADLRTVE